MIVLVRDFDVSSILAFFPEEQKINGKNTHPEQFSVSVKKFLARSNAVFQRWLCEKWNHFDLLESQHLIEESIWKV